MYRNERSQTGKGKTCAQCGQRKHRDDFPERMNNLDMRGNTCKSCISEKGKKREAEKKKIRAQQIKYF